MRPPGARRWRGASVARALAGVAGLAFVAVSLALGIAAGDAIRPGPLLAAGGREVVVLPTSGVVDDVLADYVAGGIAHAESDGAAAVIVQLDTPGGSSAAMDRIRQSLYAKLPTIVWVGPSGAKAASAGAFIALSANLVYMAPSTNIGAASPVASNGQDLSSAFGQTEAAKIKQNAVATIRAIAQDRHPQAVEWAATMVENASSYSAQDALASHGINGIAGSLDEVLQQANGQTARVNGRDVTIAVAGATTITISESPIQTVLHALDDPNIAFILLVIGVIAILLELFHPTLLVGLVGALALAVSFYASGSLPLNVLGVTLVALGLTMVALEAHFASHGLLTVGGLVCFVVGALVFYGTPGPFEEPAVVAWPVIAVSAAAAAAFGLIVVQTILRNRRLRRHPGSGMIGEGRLVGSLGEARTDLAPLGTVFLQGEDWTARSENGAIEHGAPVRVVRQEGLILVVEPLEPEHA